MAGNRKKGTGDQQSMDGPVNPAGLAIRRVRVADLHHDPANARKHPERNLRTIRSSLKEFGQVEPLVVQKGTGKVIGGNGRLDVLIEMGAEEVDVVELDIDHSRAAALGIVLNRSAEQAEWDFQALSSHLGALQADGVDLADLGWEPHEVEPLLAADWTPPTPGEMPQGNESAGKKDGEDHPYTVVFAPDKFAVVEQACDRVREIEGDEDMATARCIELICGDWLNDPNWHGEAAE